MYFTLFFQLKKLNIHINNSISYLSIDICIFSFHHIIINLSLSIVNIFTIYIK